MYQRPGSLPSPAPPPHPSWHSLHPHSDAIQLPPPRLYYQCQRGAIRAQQACDQCRAKKTKCDEARPSCGHCKISQIQCNYKSVSPNKHERTTQMVLEKLELIDGKLSQLDEVLQCNFETLLTKQDLNAAQELLGKSIESQSAPEDVKVASDDELLVPIAHTTAAHELLFWPSIQKLLPEKVNEDYVMILEEIRGPIRPYGRGEQPASPMMSSPCPGARFGARFGTKAGILNLDPDVIRSYHNSYLQNMHVLHPILGQPTLAAMITKFISNYSPSQWTYSGQGVLKRKRLDEIENSGSDQPNSLVIPRSMDNAIVLLVFALGEICTWRKEIPALVWEPPLRNMDVVPGMAYYAIASDILGNLQGGNDLAYVQACLLAALYTGQLAHPFSSHGWISQAARACQILVRPRRYSRMPDGPLKDLICYVFWTCLQLESDILAELELPASGISRLERQMNFPNIDSAQIHLRKVLNQIHSELYKAGKSNGERRTQWSTKIQEVLASNLEQWRTGLPDHMKWDDSDPPSNDLNVACLRAKYYGAQYIIHRPLLHYALHPMSHKPPSADSPASSAPSHVSPHAYQFDSMRLSHDAQSELDPKVLSACRTCVEAAMNSTTAFDGVQGRPIITNIFGTAHTQFGNMLVLAATYTSAILKPLVDGERLRILFLRTIKFLMETISPTLRKDAEILTIIGRKLFDQPQQQNFATNFAPNGN